MTEKRPAFYQEQVKMPKASIGLNCFFFECSDSPETGVFPLHWHDHLEMISVQEGWLEVTIEQTTYRCEKGDIAIVNPCQLHESRKFSRDTKLYCLMLDLDLFRNRFVGETEEAFINPLAEGKILFKPKLSGCDEICELIRKSYRVFAGEELAFQFRLMSLMCELMYHLFRDHLLVNTVPPHKNYVSVSRERVNAILAYIDEHYTEKIKLEDLVDVVHINKFYICKIFQQCTGKTLFNYVNIVRIQKATELLIGTNRSVTNIALSVGFQDINYFSRTFKSIMGMSPMEMRKKYTRNDR